MSLIVVDHWIVDNGPKRRGGKAAVIRASDVTLIVSRLTTPDTDDQWFVDSAFDRPHGGDVKTLWAYGFGERRGDKFVLNPAPALLSGALDSLPWDRARTFGRW